jgi:hypothetical protein
MGGGAHEKPAGMGTGGVISLRGGKAHQEGRRNAEKGAAPGAA